MAYNGTGRPEKVGGGDITINGGVHLHGVQDPAALVGALQAYAKRNGPIKLPVRS
jgi:hypothetical protein